ncbi:GNAT family N-acetyltransferase [Sporosarcina sp. 179-K 3D1 HS]|uniref:GNAT family N-acetyltransferase n=1 Tax=Sporosarcina sp. 179-K 3D1 HS TaxID=3232169 RepID=UPI0039A15242
MTQKLQLKDGRSVTVRSLMIEHLDEILTLQQKVIAALTTDSFLQPLSAEEYSSILNGNGMMIGAFSGDELIAFRAMLEPDIEDEEHLGKDARLPKEDWHRILYSEITNVDPDFRGNGLQSILGNILLVEIDTTRYHYICTTVAPFNIASLKDKFSLGFQIVALKEKYGTLLRYIMMREVNPQAKNGYCEQRLVEMGEIEEQQVLLEAGWVGAGMTMHDGKWWIQLEKSNHS